MTGGNCRGCLADGCPSGGLTVLSYVSAHLARLLPTTLKLGGKSTGLVGGTNKLIVDPFSSTVHDLLITVCRLNMRRVVIVTRSGYNTYRVGKRRVGRLVLGHNVRRSIVSAVKLYNVGLSR